MTQCRTLLLFLSPALALILIIPLIVSLTRTLSLTPKTPKAKTPKAKTTKAETPKAETQKAETPKAETPGKTQKELRRNAIDATVQILVKKRDRTVPSPSMITALAATCHYGMACTVQGAVLWNGMHCAGGCAMVWHALCRGLWYGMACTVQGAVLWNGMHCAGGCAMEWHALCRGLPPSQQARHATTLSGLRQAAGQDCGT